jgi:hypothetical protein
VVKRGVSAHCRSGAGKEICKSAGESFQVVLGQAGLCAQGSHGRQWTYMLAGHLCHRL